MAQFSHIFADFDEVSFSLSYFFLKLFNDSMESVRFYKCWRSFMHSINIQAPIFFFQWCFNRRGCCLIG